MTYHRCTRLRCVSERGLHTLYKVKYIIYNCTICQFYCSPSDDVVRRCKDTHTHSHTHIHARRQRSRMRNSDDDIVIVYILFRANLRLANK